MTFMNNYDPLKQINEAINEALTPFIGHTEQLEESLNDLRLAMQVEDRGWQLLKGSSDNNGTGLSLEDVKNIAQQAEGKVAGAALEKRAVDLHTGYVWGGGVEFEGVLRDPNQKGRTPDRVLFWEDVTNQENLFSEAAMAELQKQRFITGNVVVFCDKQTKKVRRIPFDEIAGVLTHPEYRDEITAWLRSYTLHKPDGSTEVRKLWVYSNRFKGVRQKSIRVGQESVPVSDNLVAVDLRVNRQTGHLYGVPDAAAGMHWTEAYGQALRHGMIVNESLAKIIYKVVSKKKDTAQNVGVKLGKAGAGGGVSLGEGQDIQLVNTTQRAYDFTASWPLASMAASAWSVTTPDLLASSQSAGSSYGSLNALTAGNQNAMKGMQKQWTRFFQDIFEVLGMGRPAVSWEPMEEQDPYRVAQALTLLSVALTDEEYRAEVLDLLDLPGNPKDVPDSLRNRALQGGSNNFQAASPDQGRGNGTGGADSGLKNDQRDDLI